MHFLTCMILAQEYSSINGVGAKMYPYHINKRQIKFSPFSINLGSLNIRVCLNSMDHSEAEKQTIHYNNDFYACVFVTTFEYFDQIIISR